MTKNLRKGESMAFYRFAIFPAVVMSNAMLNFPAKPVITIVCFGYWSWEDK